MTEIAFTSFYLAAFFSPLSVRKQVSVGISAMCCLHYRSFILERRAFSPALNNDQNYLKRSLALSSFGLRRARFGFIRTA